MRSYQGYGSRIDIDVAALQIARTGLGALLRPAGARVALNTITGVTFKPASFVRNGLLQVNSWAVPKRKPKPSEPCTVAFTRQQLSSFQALAAWLAQLAEWNRQHAPAPLPAPVADAPSDAPRSSAGGIRRVQATRRPTGFPATEAVYTAIDLQTTGLKPGRDTIVEVGLVKFTGDGRTVDEFATLVNNPGSSPAARDVHKLEDVDLLEAPFLEQVLPELFAFLNGTVLVDHNLDFEESFLLAVARRHGFALPDVRALCTLETCRRQLEGRTFSLRSMYKVATGEWAPDLHTALGDARATRAVLLWLLRDAPQPLHLTQGPPPTSVAEPHDSCLISARPVPLAEASLAALLDSFPQSNTPRQGDPTAVATYRDLLDDYVDDGRLSFQEAEALTRQARRTRLTGPQLRELHRQAWQAAFPDDADADWASLSSVRRREMFLLAEALGLTELAARLRQVIERLAEPPPPPQARYLRKLRIAVCGDDPQVTALRERAEDHGAKIAVKLTKTVAWLASSTPESDDKRHTSARALGIPIISAQEGRRRIDAAIDEADLLAFERQRQVDEQRARAVRRLAAAEASWRPAWRARELDRDPEPRRKPT